MGISLDELKRRAEEARENQNKAMRERYQLARDLGFSADEALVLRGFSEDKIRELAAERKNRVG